MSVSSVSMKTSVNSEGISEASSYRETVISQQVRIELQSTLDTT